MIFSNHDARLIYISQWLLMSVIGGALFVFPWLVVSLTHSAASASLASVIQVVAYLVFAIPAGVSGDRISRRSMLALTSLFLAIVLLMMSVLAATHHLRSWNLWIGAFLIGAAVPFLDSAAFGTLIKLLGIQNLSSSGALLSAAELGGVLMGTLAFGLLIVIDPLVPLIAMSLCAGVASLICLAIRDPLRGESLKSGGMFHQASEGFKIIFGIKEVRRIMIIGILANISIGISPILFLPYAKLDLHLSSSQTSSIVTISGILSFAGSLFTIPLCRRLGVPKTLILSLGLASTLTIILGLVQGAAVAIIVYLVGLGLLWSGIAAVIIVIERQRGAPAGTQSLVATSSRLCVWSGWAIGSTIMGQMTRVISIRSVFQISGGLLLLTTLLAIFLFKSEKPPQET